MYWSRLGVRPPALGAPAAVPSPAAPAPTLAFISAPASLDGAVTAAKSLRSASPGIFSSSRLISPARRLRSSAVASASTKCPVRACGAPNSIDPKVHASVSVRTRCGLSDGVRALPLFIRSSPRARSSARRERLTP